MVQENRKDQTSPRNKDKCNDDTAAEDVRTECSMKVIIIPNETPVADPGFSRGGGANSPGGRQHMILPKFAKNCMKLKEFGPPGGAPVQNETQPRRLLTHTTSSTSHTGGLRVTYCKELIVIAGL